MTTWSTWEAGVVVPDFDSLALGSNGEVDEADIVVNRASQLLGIAYESLVQSLRGRGMPVYVFPYDWRYSMVRSAKKLVNYVLALQRKIFGRSLPPIGTRRLTSPATAWVGWSFGSSWPLGKAPCPTLPFRSTAWSFSPRLTSDR